MVNTKNKPRLFYRSAVWVALVSVAVTYLSSLIGKYTVFLAVILGAVAVFLLIKRNFRAAAVFVICAAVAVNLSAAHLKLAKVRLLCESEVSGEMVVTADGEYSNNTTTFTAKTKSGELPGGVNICFSYKGKADIKSGDVIKARFHLKDIQNKQRKTYYSEDIYATAKIISLTKEETVNCFYSLLGTVRRYVKTAYLKFSSGDNAALLIAVTLGDKSLLSGRLYYAIRETGVSHMIAVSGFHLAVIIGNLFLIINRLLKNRFSRFAVSFAAVLVFAGVCGFTKSVMRAGSMFLISAAAPLFNRESDTLSSLALSVPAVFLISPFSIFSIGFNLSLLSTFAIVYTAPYFIDALSRLPVTGNRYLLVFEGIIINSFFAALYAMPALIMIFGKVSVVSVFANLLLNYIVTLALSFGALVLVVYLILGAIAKYFFYAAAFFADGMIVIIKGLNELPVTSVKMGNGMYFFSIAAVTAVTVYVYYKNKRMRGEKSEYGNSLRKNA